MANSDIESAGQLRHPTRMIVVRTLSFASCVIVAAQLIAAENPFAADPQQKLERTCFQTSQPWSGLANLRSDVAIVYGIGPTFANRAATWRDHGYSIHLMTGVAWGQYQDYVSGKFDGINHEDERQTDRNGNPHGHGDDIYYMCPGTNYGKYLCTGIQHALDAGVEAIHLEEPEFWVQDGYEEGFKREWRSYYNEDWQAPHSSVDAQWRASKLKYFLYSRALQQIFDYVQDYNRRAHRAVRCYVPTHSLINYAQWRIVSPESSLARLNGCDGYIAQVWTGTARTPNFYQGKFKERTFETAFLEYGAMQNLVRSTGRRVWYLNDPIEDNPNHDWNDYKKNWESTLTASLLQPEIWRYEVAPWPERIFGRSYPRNAPRDQRKTMPPAYAAELQLVFGALNDMHQTNVQWDCGTPGIGVLVSDSLMFQRGDPTPSDLHLGHFYGMALPLLKRGMPITPVQLENLTVPGYLDAFQVLLLSYRGMKPLSPDVHTPLAQWVKKGGILVVCDDDADPYNKVREWWNTGGKRYNTPREHLFETLGISKTAATNIGENAVAIGKGGVCWLKQHPTTFTASVDGEASLIQVVKKAVAQAKMQWKETNYLMLRRGPYVIASGLDESVGNDPRTLKGKFINLFDGELRVTNSVTLAPESRFLLYDLATPRSTYPKVVASSCKALARGDGPDSLRLTIEGVADTPAVLLISAAKKPRAITLGGKPVENFNYSDTDHLLWVRMTNEAEPRELSLEF
jgi:hypothetical protein